jgi:glycosyltransferase involved in cell wall biosynthesis
VKLAFVVQRYGADIAGGSEAHCRALALRLSGSVAGLADPRAAHQVTVLTTCARDYVTWRNAYPPGESRDGRVRVVRFPVARPRRMQRFAAVSDDVFDGGAPPARQHEWFRENGPDSPELLAHLSTHGHSYDLVLFWTFRYATSYFGLPLVADRAILLPTAEDDPAVRLDVLEEFFRRPAGFLFLTPEEQDLVRARAGRLSQPDAIIGAGLDRVAAPDSRDVLRAHEIEGDFVLYLGRIDRNKGCHTLFEYFQEYAAGSDGPPLVLAGPSTMRIPAHPRIRALGYVSDALREALLAHARALVVPSRYESLSIVLLEAWNHAVPTLVNAECAVLAGQVRRANGGLWYRSAADFQEALDCLVRHDDVRDRFGRQGLAYVEREYRWPTVLGRVTSLMDRVGLGRGPDPGSGPEPGTRVASRRP